MAFLSSRLNLQRLGKATVSPLLQRLSVRSIKGIAAGFLLGIVLEGWLFWQPAYLHFRLLQQEKAYWLHVLRIGVINTKTDPIVAAIPTMDQLPDLIEQCRGEFVKTGVDVAALNVERFGERREAGKGASLDYSLVRLHLQGNWEGIVTSLKTLEEIQEGNIHPQEVILDPEGGEALLQIYFRSGE